MFLNPYSPVRISKRKLPYWKQEGVIYFITFRLGDSVPQSRLCQWSSERNAWLVHHPEPWTDDIATEFHQTFTQRFEHWLDQGSGSCHFKHHNVSEIVASAFTYFEDERYTLDAWVVMPNHVHVLCQPIAEHDISVILHSWKSFTANKINSLLGLTGHLWQEESYTRIVRDEEHLHKLREYIQRNPTRANVQVHHASWL